MINRDFKRYLQVGYFGIQPEELKSMKNDLCSFDCKKCGSYDPGCNVCRACSLFIDFDSLDVHMPELSSDYEVPNSDCAYVRLSEEEVDKLFNSNNS